MRNCSGLTIGAIATLAVLMCGRLATSQEVTTWWLSVCVADGMCPTPCSACVGASIGSRCRYCADPQRQYFCEYEWWSSCHSYQSIPADDCGLVQFGLCNGAGKCEYVSSPGTRCKRAMCY